MVRNPFSTRTPINNDDDFIGRERELGKIVELVTGAQAQSLALYGERRIGKTSLLKAFARRQAALLGDEAPSYHIVVCSAKTIAKPGELILQLIERVSASLQTPAASTTSTEALLDLVHTIAMHRQRLVILVDDFDTIAMNPDFDIAVFDFLRSIVSDSPVSMILTSRRRLLTVVADELKGSPFFNVFSERRLDGLDRAEVMSLIARGGQAGVDLTPCGPWIRSVAGGFPLLLQMACGVALEGLQRATLPSNEELDEAFAEAAEPYFRAILRDLDEEELECLAAVVANDGPAGDGAVRRRLVDAGYLRATPKGLDCFSPVFRTVVAARLKHEASRVVTPPVPMHKPGTREVRVFVSYAHEDVEVLGDTHLLGYLSGLKRQGVTFWDDRQIGVGSDWKPRILDELARADVILLLVSQYWLNSDFVRDVEVGEAMRRRERGGLAVIPVLLAPSAWEDESWLSRLQMLPAGARPLTDFVDDRGTREAAFLAVLRAIRQEAMRLRGANATGPGEYK